MVIKSDDRREPFNREKLREGIMRACEKRPIGPDVIERIVAEIEYELQDYVMQVRPCDRGKGDEETQGVGPRGLYPLCVRLPRFQDLDAFHSELEKIRHNEGKAVPDFHPGRGRRSQKLGKKKTAQETIPS